MRFILIICFFSITFFSYCQTPTIEWQNSFGGGKFDGNDNYTGGSVSVCQTSDGGSIVVGETYSTDGNVSGNHGGQDIWVIKLNAKGKLKWQKCLGGSGSEYPRRIQQTIDNGYIIIGTTTSTDGDVSGIHGNADAWIIKLDANGNILWQKCFGGSNADQGGDIQQTKDSGYIVACATQSFNGDVVGNFHGYSDFWIIKLDKEGTIIWQKVLGGSFYEQPYNIEQTFDSGYIVAGVTDSYDGDVTGNHGGAFDGWVVKLNSSGNLEWQKCLGGSASDETRSIKPTLDSGFIVACYAFSNDGDAIGNHGSDDYLIIKLDKHGDVNWKRCYGGSQFDDVQNIQNTENGFIIAGFSNSANGDVTGNHGNFDYWILKTDSLGKIIWQTSLGGTNNDEAFSINYKNGIGYLIGGESNSINGDITNTYGNYDFWIVKLKDDAILPVNLLNFTAQKQNSTSLLQWQTANEINNSYFSIERSADSKAFNAIGSVDGLNRASISNYSFADKAPLKGINYYRLKQVDKDGKFTYSNVESVDFTVAVPIAFSLFPNPVSNNVNATIPLTNSVSQLNIYDATGKKIINETVPANESFKQINLSKLSSGLYVVELVQNDKHITLKLIKK